MTHTDSGPSVGAAHSFTQTHAHTQWCIYAACEWLRSGVKHWLTVFGQVNLPKHSAQQQQVLNRPLVRVQLHSAGRVAAKIIWSETCSCRLLSWICRCVQYCVCGTWYRLLHLFMEVFFYAWLFSTTPCFTYTHSFSNTNSHMVAAQHNHNLSVELRCRSCRGLIALLKGIIVINIDRRESLLCQDYLSLIIFQAFHC